MDEIRVLVVDDEQIVREFFAKIFPWDQVGMRWIGEAADGSAALEKCNLLRPDLVLTDISMPVMDGLQLIQRIRQELPDTACVILTVHEDFEKIQAALRLGALDYMAKAATTPDEMVLVLKRVRLQIREQQQQSNLGWMQRQWIIRLLNGKLNLKNLPAERSRFKLSIRDNPLRVLVIQVEGMLEINEDQTGNEFENLPLGTNSMIQTANEQLGSSEWALIRPDSYAIVANCEPGDDLSTFFRQVQAQLHTEHAVSGGNSGPYPGLKDAPTAWDEAEHALASRFYHGANQLISKQPPWRPIDQALRSNLEQLAASPLPMNNPYADYFEQVIVQGLTLCQQNWIAPQETRLLITEMLGRLVDALHLNLSSWDQALWPIQAQNASTTLQLQDWAMNLIGRLLAPAGFLKMRPEIRRVVDEILSNPSRSLDITGAAGMAGLHPNYFSSVFRKETGQNFTDYLDRIRMERAAEYLLQGTWSAQQVAEMVGISNYRTFFNVFRRTMGTSPSQFIKQFSISR